jgi:hypothetical protein
MLAAVGDHAWHQRMPADGMRYQACLTGRQSLMGHFLFDKRMSAGVLYGV